MHWENSSKHYLRRSILAALIGATGVASTFAPEPLHFPALVDPASNEHHA